MPGWREETGVATRIAWGERGANDGRTGLVSGLWYLLDVIDGERARERERVEMGETVEEGLGEDGGLPLPAHGLDLIVF